MRFVWDARKNRLNRAKHRVSFENAARVFDDPFALSIQDRIENGEERWQTIGMIGSTVVVVVAHTVYEEKEEDVIRIISARKATARERRIYATQGTALE
ncbi:MAG TPA: BrnT family toxin [Candidatus Acidoferrales bacterium]|nr:BrnT family toxin [Candidatus Acidoferrales bacterium]